MVLVVISLTGRLYDRNFYDVVYLAANWPRTLGGISVSVVPRDKPTSVEKWHICLVGRTRKTWLRNGHCAAVTADACALSPWIWVGVCTLLASHRFVSPPSLSDGPRIHDFEGPEGIGWHLGGHASRPLTALFCRSFSNTNLNAEPIASFDGTPIRHSQSSLSFSSVHLKLLTARRIASSTYEAVGRYRPLRAKYGFCLI